MKDFVTTAFILFNFSTYVAASPKGLTMKIPSEATNEITLRIASKSFSATLLDNESAKRLRELFPLTIRMKDLHSNEKYFDLPNALPSNESRPNTIRAGDIMLYGTKTLVVFYKTFSSSYSYTRLGQVNDPASLESALGSGDVTLSFASLSKGEM